MPCKDSIEDIRGKKLVPYENFVWTLSLILISMVTSMLLLNIGTIMTLLGATTNTAIGFLLPIIYYLRATRKAPRFRVDRLLSMILFVFISCASVITLTLFTMK